ncbi:MAG: RNA-binding protein [Cyanobacteriota bacterium]|nr:RNA-binding protein [Cyanobacteriota bacterium]
MSVRLYVGNLPKDVIERQELQEIFAEEGESVVTKLISDRKTGKCRGFGFVTVATDEEADKIIEKYNGSTFKESSLKIEKALPRSKGKEGSNSQEEEEPRKTNRAPAPGKGKKSRRSDRDKDKFAGSNSSGSNNEAVQPDPRWANALAELKEKLAATTN